MYEQDLPNLYYTEIEASQSLKGNGVNYVTVEPFDLRGICGDSEPTHSLHTRKGTTNSLNLMVCITLVFKDPFK